MPDGISIPGGPVFIGFPQPPDVPCDPTGDGWRGPPGPTGPVGPAGPQGLPGALTGGVMTGPLYWTATGTTASRAAQDRSRAWLNIQDFGATIDGTTSDTAAISAALNVAGTNGTIWYPYGSGNMQFTWTGISAGPTTTPLRFLVDGTLGGGARINRSFQSRNNLGDLYENFYRGTKFLSVQTAQAQQPSILQLEYAQQIAGTSADAGWIHTPIYVVASDNVGSVSSIWGVASQVDSYSNQSVSGFPQQVGVSATMRKRGTAWCAGIHITASDYQIVTGNSLPSSAGGTLLGLELGYHPAGSVDDANNGQSWGGVGTRMGIHLSLSANTLVAGTLPAEISYGILADGASNSITKSVYGTGTSLQCYQVLDTRGADPPSGYAGQVAAVRMLHEQIIDFNGGAALNSVAGSYLQYRAATSRLYYVVAGVDQWSVDASGNVRARGTITGSTTP